MFEQAEFERGDKVRVLKPHGGMGGTGEVVEAYEGPFYAIDFGDGEPHRWYAEVELAGSEDEEN